MTEQAETIAAAPDRVLVVDDDAASCRTLELHLKSQGYRVAVAHSVDEGLVAAGKQRPDLLILDIRMPGRSGLEGLPAFKSAHPEMRIVMITAFHDMESTIQAMQRGADDYIRKPIDIDELDKVVSRLLARHDRHDVIGAADDSIGPHTMVGRSRAMNEVFKTIGRVAAGPVTVLITGESGTGKELVARAIHRSGRNPDGPFVAINCAALVETLLESDMFGHERGAFTGATDRQPGKFALASDGTIFLDEVSELTPATQAKLLRVLQEKEFTPLGAKAAQKTNARVIAATNVDLAGRVQQGRFREDLYYRLRVVDISLPPLRERKEDILDLVQALLGRINRQTQRNVNQVAMDVIACFMSYDWPGNVRELENVLARAVALSSGNTITRDLVSGICERPAARGDVAAPATTGQSLKEVEKAYVERVLESTAWHRGRACAILGVSRPRLRRMIRQFGLVPPPGAPADEEADSDEEPSDGAPEEQR